MMRIPPAALGLGLAGVVPFVWGAVTQVWPGVGAASGLMPMFLGTYVALTYGMVILSFMSGVLWGFAARADGPRATFGYAVSVIPALWAFFMVNADPAGAVVNLAAGFVALLGLDAMFLRWGLAPPWWMRLRVILTVAVLACLAVVA